MLEIHTARGQVRTWDGRPDMVGGRVHICEGSYEVCEATRQQFLKAWCWPPLMHTVMTKLMAPPPADRLPSAPSIPAG